MANKKRRKGKSKAFDSVTIAERELAKGNAKTAVKHARLAYRQDPSEPKRSLLQRALFSRAQNLHRRAMPQEARRILQELNSLGDPAPEVDRLNVLLGVGDAAAHRELLDADPTLLWASIDQAVMDGPGPGLPAEYATRVRQVREALQSISAGQDKQARALVASIDRSSPLSDWRLFIRGLIAFYTDDTQRRDANWSRLDASRAARRIAEVLTVAHCGPKPSLDAGAHAAAVALSSPLTWQLRQLQRAVNESRRWTTMWAELTHKYGDSHAEMIRRITEILAASFCRRSDRAQLERLTQVAPPPPLDPKFHRIWALFHELDEEVSSAVEAWEAYVEDLKHLQQWTAAQRNTAAALVYERMAMMSFREGKSLDACSPSLGLRPSSHLDASIESFYDSADAYFEQSRRLEPQLLGAALGHGRLLAYIGERKRAAKIYKEVGQRFADDFEALLEVVKFFADESSDAVTAKKYARHAQKLRPRDECLARWLWRTSLECARLAARQKQFGIALGEVEDAEEFLNPSRPRYLLLALRAAIEFKARNVDGGERYLQLAKEDVQSAPAALLATCAFSYWCGINTRLRGELNGRMKKAVSHAKKSCPDAGELARVMNALSSAEISYHGNKAHATIVTETVRKCRRRNWNQPDLVSCCHFAATSDNDGLLQELALQGRKLFPENPYFSFYDARCQMGLGPLACDRTRAREGFQQALQLHQRGDSQLDEESMRLVSDGLRTLDREDEFDEMEDDLDDVDGIASSFERAMDPEIQEILDELGVDVDDLVASAMSGESPEEFLERHLQRGTPPARRSTGQGRKSRR